jgi:predicted nucleotidyltransferase
MLIEVARQRGNYLPELSFGTHFFQDLVEASIRYLPLYPDDPTTVFNELFFRRSRNVLQELLPEFAHLAETLRVTDVPLETDGLILRVLMNADLDQAVGFLSPPQQKMGSIESEAESVDRGTNEHWRWRFRMAQRIAADLDPQKFGVNAFYLIGSTKNATAGPASDIDILLHFQGNDEQMKELLLWLEGWSRCLAEINFLRTGYRSEGLLDVHLVTDRDIAERSSFAVKIDAITDPARKLPMKDAQALN